MPIDPLTIVMVVILAALIFFMFRSNRKRQREQAETRSKMVAGAEVMTNFGLYGTLLSVDEDENIALIETSPGHVVKVHRQVLARVVEPTVADEDADGTLEQAGDSALAEPALNEDTAIRHDAPTPGEPEFGERVDGDARKPGSKSDD